MYHFLTYLRLKEHIVKPIWKDYPTKDPYSSAIFSKNLVVTGGLVP